LDLIQYLLDQRDGVRADIHADDDDALVRAAENGHLAVVEFLLDQRDGERANIRALYGYNLNCLKDMGGCAFLMV